jgi:hypothetical protein
VARAIATAICRRRDGGRLVLLHQDGPDGHGPEVLARSGGDEQAAARHGLRDHDQRLAALCARRPLLRELLKKGWLSIWPTARRPTACPTTAPARTSTPPIPRRRSGTGRRSATTSQQGIRLAVGRRDRARPASQRRYFHIGPGTQFFNVYPLFHTGGALRRLPQGRARSRRALILSRDATWARSATAPSSGRRTSIPPGTRSSGRFPPASTSCGFGTDLLEQRHRRLAVSARGASSGAPAAARPLRRARQRGRLRRLSGALHALVPVRDLPAHHAHPRQPPANEVWSYGKQAEPILEKYLRCATS